VKSALDRRFLLAALEALPLSYASAFAQAGEPAGIVTKIFEAYLAGKIPDPPWSPAVRARMRRADLGADPILDAQDIDVKQFTLGEFRRTGDAAAVEVRFESFGRSMHSVFDFRFVDGRWVIANYQILSGAETPTDLRRALKMAPLK
jgi:hypothetical protein